MCQINEKPSKGKILHGYRAYDYDGTSSFYGSQSPPPMRRWTEARRGPFHAFSNLKSLRRWWRTAQKLATDETAVFRVALRGNLMCGDWEERPDISTITGMECKLLSKVPAKKWQ